MRAIVTGTAGFVGSHLTDSLLADGHTVVGIDCFTDYYDPRLKHENVRDALTHPRFELVVDDLCDLPLVDVLEGADVVFHQAAQAGVRSSWAEGFATYALQNVVATQRLLEAATRVGTPRFVYASSSSVYGDRARCPTVEGDLPKPHSPYGVTKLAAEHLCNLYAANHGLSTVSLRYFTVYGPRQRPDMAIRRLVDAAIEGHPFPLFGSGRQVRDFTFVSDVVRANLAAAVSDVAPGTVVNIAGGSDISMNDLVVLVGEVVGRDVDLARHPAQVGDVDRTGGSIDAARALLGWEPLVPLAVGIDQQAAWSRRRVDEVTARVA